MSLTSVLRSKLSKIPIAHTAYWKTQQVKSLLQYRKALAEANRRDASIANSSGVPVPPAHLRHRVHGDLSADNFLVAGSRLAKDLRDLLISVERKPEDFDSILDHGCGCGRVLRFFEGLPIHGTDIDPELVQWCQANFPGRDFTVNPPEPPSPFKAGQFDWIYAISVITHLPEGMQRRWIAELSRITRPGGIVILTFHGEETWHHFGSEIRETIAEDGFFYLTGARGKLKLDGLPDFYQTSYQTIGYLERECAPYFDVLKHVPKSINNHQDAVILKLR